ncbi:MAG: TetR/AcrR family transcriptional regulator [Pseudomonadales bacterium]
MPQQPTSAREQAKNQRRDDILEAARRLIRQSRDFSFSMRALAEEAGVSIATPYNLFGSKQAILLAVLDADLAHYQAALGALKADAIDVLFEAVTLMTEHLTGEPDFYRSVLAGLSKEGGPRFRMMVSGPRYLMWKRLLGQAAEAGLIRHDLDPDAFAVTLSQLIFANVIEWAQGTLTPAEMDARIRYGLALALLAVATDRSRKLLDARLRGAEQALQRLWRNHLSERLKHGPLDDDTRALLADQLKHLDHPPADEASQ